MNADDRQFQEQLLQQLDKGGWLFEHFHLRDQSGRPSMIGHGGTAGVYQVDNELRPDISYVVKAIGCDLHEGTPGRERDAARLQQMLYESSPNIVRLIEVRELFVVLDRYGEITEIREVSRHGLGEQGGGYYLLLELMEQLQPLLVRNRYGEVLLARPELSDPEEVLRLAMEIGQALAKMHENGILHRDIKLENIFWNTRTGNYQLGDFGSVRQTENGNAETRILTRGYSAPEIERSLTDSYNASADIYSLGMTLYLLLNDLRFPGSRGYYCNAELQYNPEYEFAAPANAAPELTRIIRRMCCYDPAGRYHNARTLLSDLATCAKENETFSYNLADVIDTATETFYANEEWESAIAENQIITREEWRADRHQKNKTYRIRTALQAMVLTLLFGTLYYSVQIESVYNGARWTFWLLPVLLFVECGLQHIKDMYRLGGVLIFIYAMAYCIRNGWNAVCVIMGVVAFAGIPVMTGAAAAGALLWLILTIHKDVAMFVWMQAHDLGWILLIIIILISNYACWTRYLCDRIDDSTWVRGISRRITRLYPAMAIVGAILLILDRIAGVPVPISVTRLHLIRVGIICGLMLLVIYSVFLDGDDLMSNNENDLKGREKDTDDE